MSKASAAARTLRGVLAGAAALAIGYAGTAAAAPAAGEYGVGFITENTGPLAAAGVSYHRGAQLAVDEINEGAWIGQGVKLKLNEKESGSDAARAVQALTQFSADRNVIAVTCCILSPVAAALKPVTTNAKLPLVIYGATLPGLPQPPYVTSVVGLPGPQEVKMSKMLAETLKPKTVAYFVNADNEGFQNRFKAAQKVMEEAGVKTAGVVSILSADTDFTAPATQAMATNPDLIMVWTTQTPAAGIIAALRARGYAGKISASDVISPAPVFKKIGAALAGVPFPIVFSSEISSSPEAKKFVEGYTKKFGEAPDTYSAQGYTSLYLIAQAMKSLDGKPSREDLAAALGKASAVEYNIYGGLPMVNGQAEVQNSLVAAWTADGKVVRWENK
ncbi:branched-chain amino acid ABC transporter substrate-binding protein [Alsobacter metallidurans]|uniref:Branched-chain amino acid ABC transporter substrate-binding protein n=1 Tax=Alsobacter metallidurans TaxID=340221 RepID=A0A917I4G9_9HYPH|nr:ABC transporter substrate-binding protein [Alsobacter metallidurans]GGH09973.1 branched-chain amino acid ABC transporter substrate-binding protein [Alsobacter metallidurans]